jgi:DNA-directed RNA polymerase subunit RPC12/RpoP
MGDFDFSCPRCGAILRLDETHRGRKTVCPSCHSEIVIPVKMEEQAPQPKIVVASPAPSAGNPPQEEKDVLSFRPTLKMYLGKLSAAALLTAAAIALAIIIKAGPALDRVIIAVGLIGALGLLLNVLYRKYSILYRLSTQRLFAVRGLVSRRVEELELFRVRDIQVAQNFWERVLGFGRMTVVSTDATAPKFEMAGILNPLQIKDTIRVHFRNARLRERVRPTEFIADFDADELADKDPGF